MKKKTIILLCVLAGMLSAATRVSVNDFHSFPNPFQPETEEASFALTLSDNTLFASADIAIFNTDGFVVYTKKDIDAVTPAGDSLIVMKWRGIDNAGRILPNGLYFVRITIRTTDGDIRHAVCKTVIY